jgi:hypothetical protein
MGKLLKFNPKSPKEMVEGFKKLFTKEELEQIRKDLNGDKDAKD